MLLHLFEPWDLSLLPTNETVQNYSAWSFVLLLLRVERNFQESLNTARLEQSPEFLSLGDLLKAKRLATDKSKIILFSFLSYWQPQHAYCQTTFPWGWEFKFCH